jgi:hypothetical protein
MTNSFGIGGEYFSTPIKVRRESRKSVPASVRKAVASLEPITAGGGHVQEPFDEGERTIAQNEVKLWLADVAFYAGSLSDLKAYDEDLAAEVSESDRVAEVKRVVDLIEALKAAWPRLAKGL